MGAFFSSFMRAPAPPRAAHITSSTLFDMAKEACTKAYCPYSNFPVGAVVELSDGSTFVGVNVENKSYSLTSCAESGAIATMVAHTTPENRVVRRVLIYGPHTVPIMPCGACRQMMMEFADAECEVVACNDTDQQKYRLRDLLPEAF